MINEALKISYMYLASLCKESRNEGLPEHIKGELCSISGIENFSLADIDAKSVAPSYAQAQDILSGLNERESIRKAKGVYYTPADVVKFIVDNSVRLLYEDGIFSDADSDFDHGALDLRGLCKKKTVFDPTCGAGEFLLAALEKKLELWDAYSDKVTKADIKNIVNTVHGNDINAESTVIAKLRLFLCAVNRYGVEKCLGISEILNRNFTADDYVVDPSKDKSYDIIIGNPPYVEDSKSSSAPQKKYGNIYANVLVNAAKELARGGVFGFVIPLSYVATPRMKRLRDELGELVPIQYVLSYSDRPDCLFASVHQKLCILICKNDRKKEKRIYTSNYQYWYKAERRELFSNASVTSNKYIKPDYIPKIGNAIDAGIYSKVTDKTNRLSIKEMLSENGASVFLNMRAAFWIKAFRNRHKGTEYKELMFDSADKADLMLCILNSSLFWWYWVCVSDCWHITQKELINFTIPQIEEFSVISELARSLEKRLEETKAYVGTVQTEYEYKHKLCVPEIRAIDDHINALFGLTNEESEYIKRFAFKYRVSGGAADEGN